jgi:multiple sugar transport system permease protein
MRRLPPTAYLGLLAMLAFNLMPFYWMVSSSLKDGVEVVSFPATLWPEKITLEAYSEIWLQAGFLSYFSNSLAVSLSTAVFSSAFGVLAAYGFSRFRFRLRIGLMTLFLASQMVPGVLLVLPYFKLLTLFGLYDTRIGLVLALTTITLPFSVWMLKGYIDSVPIEIDQAAMIDGATRLQVLRLTVLPNIVPGLVATMTFAFLLAWGDVLWALCLISDEAKLTMTLGITRLIGQWKVLWSQIMAATVIATLIPAVLYVALQRYIVMGLVDSAVRE